MRLEITRHQRSDTDAFQYNDRKYYTENDEIIFDFLEEEANEKKDRREWVEFALDWMTNIGNSMSLGYNPDNCKEISYSIVFIDEKGVKHFCEC